jgi:uncharacterized membrane protein
MKKLFTALLFLMTAVAMGQTTSVAPRVEFTIDLSESSLHLKPGESKTVTVLLNRSKSFATANADFGFSSVLPQGITVTYEPGIESINSRLVTITAANTAAAGAYSIVLNATLRYKTKGAILKLQVGDEKIATK